MTAVSEPIAQAGAIVLLEDDRTTAALTQQVLAATMVVNPVKHFALGEEAAAYIERSVGAGSPPVLIILDLSIPDLSGLDVLKRIRALPELGAVPVIMLSGSGDDEDIEQAYAVGIDAYLVKPAGIHGLPDVVRRLGLRHVLLPRPT